MAEFTDKRYAVGAVTFPDRDINPAQKDKNYDKAWATGIYSKYTNNRSAWPREARQWWSIMRRYAAGKQDTTKYKSWLLSDGSDSSGEYVSYDDDLGTLPLARRAKREGWYNVMWDVVSPAPKIMNSIHGMFDDFDYDMYVDALDAKSKELEEDEKWRKIVEGKFIDWQTDYKKKAGIPVDQSVPLPRSEEEFDMQAANEGYKIGIAKAMQKLVKFAVEEDSKWLGVIKKKILDDFLSIGKAAVRTYYDEEDKRFKIKYIDVADLVIQYSRESDYEDSEYAGYFTYWTISNLRNKFPNEKETTWRALAQKYQGYFGNPTGADAFKDQDTADVGLRRWGYDGFKVQIFETEWIDTDIRRGLRYKSLYGRETYRRIGYNSKVKPLSEEKQKRGIEQNVEQIYYRYLRGAKWVVGSDLVFDYGPVNMAERPTPSKPVLTFKVESLQSKSVTEQLYPIYDQFFMAYLRHQNTISKMIEKGYAVDFGMLMNITDGDGKTWSWDQVLKMWKQTGILPYQTSVNGAYAGGAITPIHDIPGGLGDRLQESIAWFAWCSKMIEDITGINPVVLGATPSAEAPVATTQYSIQATTNSLRPIVNAMREVKSGASASLMRRIKIGIRNSDAIRKSYAGMIGDADMQALLLAEKRNAYYGLSIKERPGKIYRERLREYIKAALQSGRDGMPGLTFDQAMYLEERLDQGGDLIEIRQQVSYYIKKHSQQIAMQQQQNIAAQGEQQRAMAAENDRRQAELEQLKARLKMMEDASRTQNNLKEKRFTSNYDLFSKLLEQAKGVQVPQTGGQPNV